MPEPTLPTVLLNDMAYTGSMAGRGVPPRTTETQPRFAGKGNPGEKVFFRQVASDGTLEDQEFDVLVDEDGLWNFTSPELANKHYEFEMWTQNEDGEESSRHEWETTVSANKQERDAQRARNEEWESTQQEQWRETNRLSPPQGLTPTPVSAGSGGAGGTDGGAPDGAAGGGGASGTAEGSTDEPTGEHPPTPIKKAEKGNTPAT